MRLFDRRLGLKCFSPEVMLATFIIETLLGLYTLFRYRKTKVGLVIAGILFLLAAFQLAEYQICTATGGVQWAQFAMVVVTFLPVLGLYLVGILGRPTRLLQVGFAIALGGLIYMYAVPGVILGAVCHGNYVIFKGAADLQLPYAVYYFSFLLLTMFKALEHVHSPHTAPLALLPLKWLVAGYLAFIVPLGIAFAFSEGARNAPASVMCGFALVFGCILVWKVLPHAASVEVSKK